MTPLDRLLYWVREREAIRVRKEVEGRPFPWTDDPILRSWRFCCVRREDDRVTRWVKENIRDRYAGHEHLWFMLCAARQINWPSTLAWLMGSADDPVDTRMFPSAWPDSPSFEPAAMTEALDAVHEQEGKVFTGAYIITAPQKKGERKTKHVAETTLGALWRDRERFKQYFAGDFLDINWNGRAPTLKYTHEMLMRYDGWGPFLAYQAVVDMRFTPLLSSASDVHTFAAAGPGTIRGLNRLHGRPVGGSLSQDAALLEIRRLLAVLHDRAEITLDLSDVPNVLCEFDKYERVRNGEGEPRARYVPGRGS